MHSHHIRLGHSLGDRYIEVDMDGLETAVRIVTGERQLLARLPVDESTVHGAEQILGAVPRPVYAFAGDLHPDLGSVGLILSRRWAGRAVQGVTRCDSGGLYGGKGHFEHLGEAERESALRALSTPGGMSLAEWESRFAVEVTESYERGARGYVEGDEPRAELWSDGRSRCISAARARGARPDRRMWTWELRMHDAPEVEEIEALVVSHGAYKRLNHMFSRERIVVPGHVKVLGGSIGEDGIAHWFSTASVRDALLPAEIGV